MILKEKVNAGFAKPPLWQHREGFFFAEGFQDVDTKPMFEAILISSIVINNGDIDVDPLLIKLCLSARVPKSL